MSVLTKAQYIIKANINKGYEQILTNDALDFVARLHKKFNPKRVELLQKRIEKQKQIDQGIFPDFLVETKSIRESEWTVAPLPKDLLDRRVEITGPVDRKMIINALNSGAKVFMADLEDSNSPSWNNNVEGQINLKDAVNKTISYTNLENGKSYTLNAEIATLMVRPRGWHMAENGMEIDEKPVSGSLFDFGLFFFHNAKNLIAHSSGPYFYLPKLENHQEAQLWNEVFVYAQEQLGIPVGTIKATVLIETITASFEMNEILYALKDHSAGLNCGRWDYIFSFIKKFKNHPSFVLPDRDQVTMTTHFLRSYSQLVIQTCHKRNVHAMGGMAAQIPIKNDAEANEKAIEKVKNDKLREVKDGHDGTWVAHPGLVSLAMDVFNEYMPTPNQINNKRTDVNVSASDLLQVPTGTITEAGLRKNINVGILYLESWLSGNGAAAIYHLMEDAATAEISRTQVWQWLKNNSKTDQGQIITLEWCKTLIQEELVQIKQYVGESKFTHGKFETATDLFIKLLDTSSYEEFLTLKAYSIIQKL